MDWTGVVGVIIAAIVGPIVVFLVREYLKTRQETRKIIQQSTLLYGKEIAIRACDGNFVTVDLNDNTNLVAREQHIHAWEIFTIVQPSSPLLHIPPRPVRYGDKVAFQATNNHKFVGAALHQQQELTARVAHVKGWETFILLRPPVKVQARSRKAVQYGSFFALRACNGKNVTYNRDGDKRLVASASWVRGWETFAFIDPAHPQ